MKIHSVGFNAPPLTAFSLGGPTSTALCMSSKSSHLFGLNASLASGGEIYLPATIGAQKQDEVGMVSASRQTSSSFVA